MKKIILLVALAGVNWPARAKEKSYEKGVLLQMESPPCGYAEKGDKTIAGEIFGIDSEHKNTREMLCPESVLQADPPPANYRRRGFFCESQRELLFFL
jgi:hypothetical protein